MLTELERVKLSSIRHVVMDMDGTIYKGKNLFPTTLPFLEQLRRMGITYTFLTNNSSRSTDVYLEHLSHFGIRIDRSQMVTSTINTVDYLKRHHPDIKRLFMIGTESFRREMVSCGFTDVPMEEEPEAVIVAFDTALSYERLCRAAWWIKHDKLWISTHPDWECPTELETTLIDCGAVTACLKAVSNKTPIVLGKPNRAMMDSILHLNNVSACETLMCGDRMYTDIQLGVNSGVDTVLISDLPHEAIAGNIATWTVPHLGVLGEKLLEARS